MYIFWRVVRQPFPNRREYHLMSYRQDSHRGTHSTISIFPVNAIYANRHSTSLGSRDCRASLQRLQSALSPSALSCDGCFRRVEFQSRHQSVNRNSGFLRSHQPSANAPCRASFPRAACAYDVVCDLRRNAIGQHRRNCVAICVNWRVMLPENSN